MRLPDRSEETEAEALLDTRRVGARALPLSLSIGGASSVCRVRGLHGKREEKGLTLGERERAEAREVASRVRNPSGAGLGFRGAAGTC